MMLSNVIIPVYFLLVNMPWKKYSIKNTGQTESGAPWKLSVMQVGKQTKTEILYERERILESVT